LGGNDVVNDVAGGWGETRISEEVETPVACDALRWGGVDNGKSGQPEDIKLLTSRGKEVWEDGVPPKHNKHKHRQVQPKSEANTTKTGHRDTRLRKGNDARQGYPIKQRKNRDTTDDFWGGLLGGQTPKSRLTILNQGAGGGTKKHSLLRAGQRGEWVQKEAGSTGVESPKGNSDL